MTVTCPICKGRKGWRAFIDRRIECGLEWVECSPCSGTGSVTEEHAERIAIGEQARRDRIARGVGLREEAERLGVSARALSDFEQRGVALAATREGST